MGRGGGRRKRRERRKRRKVSHINQGGAYTKSWFWRRYFKKRSPLSALIPKLYSPSFTPTTPSLAMVFVNLLSLLLWTLLATVIPAVWFSFYVQVERKENGHLVTLFLSSLVSKCSLLSKSVPGSLTWMWQVILRSGLGGLVQASVCAPDSPWGHG